MKRSYRNKILYIAVLLFLLADENYPAMAYDSLKEAIEATTSPREYTLTDNETVSDKLGTMGGSSSAILTVNGGENHYGINNTSDKAETRIFVGQTNQTFNLQNVGTYTTTTSSAIVDGINIVTGVTVGNSINGFNKDGEFVGFLRSAGKSNISNSVFYNNYGRYGVVQNRQSGTMSITDSVFVNTTSQLIFFVIPFIVVFYV